jgi:hypothetical protein
MPDAAPQLVIMGVETGTGKQMALSQRLAPFSLQTEKR